MKVRMRIAIGGARNGRPWPPVGGVLDCAEREALSLVGNGAAELVPEEASAPKEVTEAAIVAPQENAAARTTAPKPRGSARSFSPKKG